MRPQARIIYLMMSRAPERFLIITMRARKIHNSEHEYYLGCTDLILKKPFGNTGHMSTVTIFGAAALSRVNQKEANRTLDLLIEYGVNHIDTAASYGNSELRIGQWMEKHRKKFFLATKTGERTYKGAKEEIHRSLERLRVESVDMIQLHNLVHL